MAKKSVSTITSIRPLIGKSVRQKLHIPQPDYRAVRLRSRGVSRWDEINIEESWFTLHKRGIRRSKVGDDPLEARAVSKAYIRGTLPERIVYQYLVSKLRMVSGVDFDFQSSMDGGRMELGGIVADFLFPYLGLVIQVDGPTHDTVMRIAKDAEQVGDLSLKGYTVWNITDDVIYDEYLFEEWMRRLFALPNNVGGGGGAFGSHGAEELINIWNDIMDLAIQVQQELVDFGG